MTTSSRARSAPAGREFPVLGASSQPVSEVTRSRFFVTGPFARTPEWSSARNIRLAHAKEMGRTTTACGLPTGSWSTLWEVPFKSERMQGACPACRLRVG